MYFFSRFHRGYGKQNLSPSESFNGRFRDECLNRELLASVLEAQCLARTFRDDYNTSRPHSSINYRTPADYRAELLRQASDSGQARQAGPSLHLKLALSPQPTHTLSSIQQPAQSLITSDPRR